MLSPNNLAYSFTVTDKEKSFYDMNTWSIKNVIITKQSGLFFSVSDEGKSFYGMNTWSQCIKMSSPPNNLAYSFLLAMKEKVFMV